MNDGGTVLNRKLFLGGGEVDGIGGERDDLVPIWASDREYVVSANGVRRMGGGNHARGIAALDEINNNVEDFDNNTYNVTITFYLINSPSGVQSMNILLERLR